MLQKLPKSSRRKFLINSLVYLPLSLIVAFGCSALLAMFIGFEIAVTDAIIALALGGICQVTARRRTTARAEMGGQFWQLYGRKGWLPC